MNSGYPTEEEKIKIITTPSLWVTWPQFPLKHRTKRDPELPGAPLTGLLSADEVGNGRFVVRIGNLFERYSEEEFEALPKEEYKSVEELLAAGWLGD